MTASNWRSESAGRPSRLTREPHRCVVGGARAQRLPEVMPEAPVWLIDLVQIIPAARRSSSTAAVNRSRCADGSANQREGRRTWGDLEGHLGADFDETPDDFRSLTRDGFCLTGKLTMGERRLPRAGSTRRRFHAGHRAPGGCGREPALASSRTGCSWRRRRLRITPS